MGVGGGVVIRSYTSKHTYKLETPMDLVQLSTGVSLEVELTESPRGQGKLAVCLHPWSWLGGRMDDPCVLRDIFILNL
jgi:hypothetical protein